jgi:hypothetical protein
MARARRTLDRKTLREQGEVAERKKKKKDEDAEEKDEEEEEDEDADEEASGEDEGGGDDDDGDDDDEKPKKKKKPIAKKKVAEKKPAKPRSRSAKVVRMKVVWVVYSNSHQPLEEFPYPKKKDAEAYLDKVTNDKKSGGPFFLQPLKKPMEKDA